MARTTKIEGAIKDKFKPLTKAEMDKLRRQAKEKKVKKGK